VPTPSLAPDPASLNNGLAAPEHSGADHQPTGGITMKKILALVTALGVAGLCSAPVLADPQSDLKEFQGHFKKAFPTVKFDEYSNGFYALPEFKDYRAMWETYNEFPPYELGLDRGKTVWNKSFANGGSFAKCVKDGSIKPAYTYPRWDKASKSIVTAELDIIACAKKAGENLPFVAAADLGKDEKSRVQLAEVTAFFYSQYRGKRVKPDVDFKDPDTLAAYEKGKKYWWTRRGQLNFSCSNCHVDLAGKDMGGNQPLSAGLGHPVGWPAQRLEWGRIETIMQRYATCNSQVRAKPQKHYSDDYLSVQLYETTMSTGLPLTAPAMRN
jgi:sulfur-oxidizing protein SoxA